MTLRFSVALVAIFSSSLALGCSANDSVPAEGSAGTAQEKIGLFTPVNLDDPAQNLEAFVKVRGSLNQDEEVVFYWTGNIYSFMKEDTFPPTRGTNKTLFKFEGINVARFVKVADGYEMWSREASFYEDPATGNIIDCWHNPLNNKDVSVVHVWNDPVNFAWKASTWTPQPYNEINGHVMFASDVLLAVPNALQPAVYPDNSAGTVYQTVELFNFFTHRALLEAKFLKSVPNDISWTRVGQFLPWMQMGQTQGNVIYQTRGQKLMGGWNDVPQKLKDVILARKPEYQHAPTSWPVGQRNTTSWTYFRSLVQAGQYNPTCTP